MDDLSNHGHTVFRGRRIELRIVEVSAGNGRTVSRELVIHPGAAVILALTDADEVVMIRNYRYTVGKELWELPAGTLEPPESPAACAVRELREETGYQAGHLEELGRFYSSPGVCTELLHAFVARDLTLVGQQLDEGEQIRVELIPLSRVRQMMLSGEIADGKTVASLGLYLLGKGG